MSDERGPADHSSDVHGRIRPDEGDGEVRVTPIELFFDLVFVFALTQVTALVHEDLTWAGMVRGLAVLAVLWWAWAGYVWLTNSVEPDEGYQRLVLLVAMTAMLIAGIAVPHAFGMWSVTFGAAYLTVRVLHVVLYLAATREDPQVFRAVVRLTPGMLAGGLLVFAAGFLDAGWPRALLWAFAIAVDFSAPVVTGVDGWRVQPAHFAERHGLAVVIALGESVIAVGLGASHVGLHGHVVVAAVVAMVAIASMWWLYFGVVAIVAERRLRAETGAARARMARDSYSYLHLPMVAGIVMFALGVEITLEHVDSALTSVPRTALLAGVATYLFAHVAFRLRNVRSINGARLTAAIVLVAAIPVTGAVAAWGVVLVAAATLLTVVVYEGVRYGDARHEVRHHGAGGDWVRG